MQLLNALYNVKYFFNSFAFCVSFALHIIFKMVTFTKIMTLRFHSSSFKELGLFKLFFDLHYLLFLKMLTRVIKKLILEIYEKFSSVF